MLEIYTGQNRLMMPALIRRIAERPEEKHFVIVPKQLTLMTERTIMNTLDLPGSFLINVLSTERLCYRIFEATGVPDGTRVDELGRVMLVRAAIRECHDELTLYRGSDKRRGFAERAAQQLERMRQAEITPKQLTDIAEKTDGASAMKLRDLAKMLGHYETHIEGRFRDGETEYLTAAAQARNAEFLKDANVWFFGFDMVPPTLHTFIASVAHASWRAGFFLPLKNDSNAADYDPFLPVEEAFLRLSRAAGGEVSRIYVGHEMIPGKTCLVLDPDRQAEALDHLEHELFSLRPKQMKAETLPIRAVNTHNPADECMYAAALARRLVIENGWKWSDILILSQDLDNYDTPLRRAFAAYNIPLFLASSRSAARHPVCECLLTALNMLETNWRAEDMRALLRTGLMPVNTYEAERFMNYIREYGLRGELFREPLTRGSENLIKFMEPIRARCAGVLIKLSDMLRKAEDLQSQLTALFGFLTDIDAFTRTERRVKSLADRGYRETAGIESQVWNRLLATLDQMHELLGTEKLSVRELHDTLEDSLSATVIKALPQSGDAVYAQSTTVVCATPCKALLLLGMTDRPASADDGLLTSDQKDMLVRETKCYLGPTADDMSRLRRYYLKTVIGMATDYLSVSCPLSGSDGSVQRPGQIFEELRTIFDLRAEGGMTGNDASTERMLRAAPGAALGYAAKALADADRFSAETDSPLGSAADETALGTLFTLSDEDDAVADGLTRLEAAIDRADIAERLDPATAERLYARITEQSVSSLERFASCPFSYFARYGLSPELIKPYNFDTAIRGTVLHDAMSRFVDDNRDRLSDMTAEDAETSMRAIADAFLEKACADTALGDSALSEAASRSIRDTLCASAAAIADHMRGSRFVNASTEEGFGGETGRFTLDNGLSVRGMIDRVDLLSEARDLGIENPYLRIIDYKSYTKKLSLDGILFGMQLQLPIYLAVAQAKNADAASAGLYYFTLNDGIVSNVSEDPAAIAKERAKNFRLDGLLPENDVIRTAMTPDPANVFTSRREPVNATQDDFHLLAQYSIDRAGEYAQQILNGECDIRPTHASGDKAPCERCDYRHMCLFDPTLRKARKLPKVKDRDALVRVRHKYGANHPEEDEEI